LLNSKQTTTLIPETNSSLEFAIKLVKFTHKIETAKHYNLYCSNDHQILTNVQKTQSNMLAKLKLMQDVTITSKAAFDE